MINLVVKIAKNAKTIYYITASVATSIAAAKGAIDLSDKIAKKKNENKKKHEVVNA